MMYDVIVVGAGAAGLTAAIYTCRKKLKTLIISADIGGQTNLTNHIENYPGVEPCTGNSLMQKFFDNATGFGAEFVPSKVSKVEKKGKEFILELANGEKYETKSLILAFGKVARSLGIPGEQKFFGRGVSTCATCDAPLYKNKTAIVVGGGNSAVEAVIELSRIAKKIYLVHRSDSFRADEISIEKLKELKNVEILLNHVLTEIKGDKKVSSAITQDSKTKKSRELQTDGVFTEIGYVVDTSMVAQLVKRNEKNEILVNERCESSCSGIFAAGDVTQVPYKQTVISAGEGAKAGLQVYNYLSQGKGSTIDWTH